MQFDLQTIYYITMISVTVVRLIRDIVKDIMDRHK